MIAVDRMDAPSEPPYVDDGPLCPLCDEPLESDGDHTEPMLLDCPCEQA